MPLYRGLASGPLRKTSAMTSKRKIKAFAGHIVGQMDLLAVGLAVTLLGISFVFTTPIHAQSYEADSFSAPSAAKRRPPAQTDVNDCSRWATTATGFNPGSTKLPPSWGEHKPPSRSSQAAYNRWVGACLGQREPPSD
jgi:hypothetical protein